MRMELADDVADDAGAFLVTGSGIEAELVHRMEDAAMHRLQPIAHIGQRARHDRRHGVGQIALAESVGEIDVAGPAERRGIRHSYKTSLFSPSIIPAVALRRIRSASRSRASGNFPPCGASTWCNRKYWVKASPATI